MPVAPPESPELEPTEQNNEFANPDSVNLQPESARQPAEESPLTGGVERRVDAAEQAGLAPDAAKIPGSEDLFPTTTGAGTAATAKKGSWLQRQQAKSRDK